MAKDQAAQPVDESSVTDEAIGQVRAVAAPANMGNPTDDQLAAIRRQVVDDTILADHGPYIWTVQASNDRLDAYYTRMHESSLRNYADDATRGISFMRGHNYREEPSGRSFAGELVDKAGNQPHRVIESFYTLRGLRPNGQEADDFINLLRSGQHRDVSISFYGGTYRCSLCDRNMASYRSGCFHFPGVKYRKDGSRPEQGEADDALVTAFAWIHDAHQSEASVVYDGATPGCMTLKARQLDDAGLLDRRAAELIEVRYRIHLPGAHALHAGHRAEPSDQEDDVSKKTTEGAQGDQDETERAQAGAASDQNALLLEAERRATAAEALVATVRSALELAEDADLAATLRQLGAEAEDGRAHRAALVEEALAEGQRARGDKFERERWEARLRAMPLAEVRAFAVEWKQLGDALFKPGRATKEGVADVQQGIPLADVVPGAMFKAPR